MSEHCSVLYKLVVLEEHLSAGILSALQWSRVHFFNSNLVTPFGKSVRGEEG